MEKNRVQKQIHIFDQLIFFKSEKGSYIDELHSWQQRCWVGGGKEEELRDAGERR